MSLSDQQRAMLLTLALEKPHEFAWSSDVADIAASLVTLDLARCHNGRWGYYCFTLTPAGKQKAIEIAKQVIA